MYSINVHISDFTLFHFFLFLNILKICWNVVLILNIYAKMSYTQFIISKLDYSYFQHARSQIISKTSLVTSMSHCAKIWIKMQFRQKPLFRNKRFVLDEMIQWNAHFLNMKTQMYVVLHIRTILIPKMLFFFMQLYCF